MEMHVYNRTYTGLGGGGQAVVWKSWERYYRPDGITPKDGVSSVQLHETMHAVGFHHTWQHEHYSSDFSWGPMGYFAFRPGTASYDKNWVQGTYLDQMEAILWDEFQTERALLGGSERPETYTAENPCRCAKFYHNDPAYRLSREPQWVLVRHGGLAISNPGAYDVLLRGFRPAQLHG